MAVERQYTKKITKKGGKVFVGAVQEYDKEDGTKLCVGFLPDVAYLFLDDDDIPMGASDLSEQIKSADKSGDGDFPDGYENYIELCSFAEGSTIHEKVKEIYGITAEIEADIKARLNELSEYTEEVDVQL